MRVTVAECTAPPVELVGWGGDGACLPREVLRGGYSGTEPQGKKAA